MNSNLNYDFDALAEEAIAEFDDYSDEELESFIAEGNPKLSGKGKLTPQQIARSVSHKIGSTKWNISNTVFVGSSLLTEQIKQSKAVGTLRNDRATLQMEAAMEMAKEFGLDFKTFGGQQMAYGLAEKRNPDLFKRLPIK